MVEGGDDQGDDTSGVSSVDVTSETSCDGDRENGDDKLARVSRRLSDELAYVSSEYAVTTPDSQVIDNENDFLFLLFNNISSRFF